MDIQPQLLVHEYTDILGEFKLHSEFAYTACAALVIAINLAIVCFFLRKRFLGENVGSIMLISLAISDIAYEMTTTVFFVQCRCYPEKTLSNDCSNQTLYSMYMTFNLSTVLHVVFQIFAEDCSIIRMQWPVFAKYASVSLSFVLWCSSSLLAYGYIYWWDDTMSFVNINVMAYLCRFKVFGYYVYVIIIFCAAFVVILLTLFVKKPSEEAEKLNPDSFMNEISYPAKAKVDQELFHTTPKEQPQLVSCCLSSAVVVGSFGWFLTLGNLTRFIEIMKWFEITRLGARLLNSLTVFSAITKSHLFLQH